MDDEIIALKIPKWGLSMEEGKIVSWQIAEGDEIAKGDEIAEIETSKIVNVFESPVSGLMRRILAAEGETLPVGALIGVLAGPEVDDASLDTFIADFQRNFGQSEAEEEGGVAAAGSADVPGGSIKYVVTGELEEGGVPALFIHGYTGDRNNWLFNQDSIAQDRAAYALDLPGHGGSFKNVSTPDLSGLTDTVHAFLAAAGLSRINLIGHSLGGAIAIKLALTYPEVVNAVVAVNGLGFGTGVASGYVDGYLSARKRKDLKPAVELLFANKSLVTRDMLENMMNFKRTDGVEETLEAIADAILRDEKIPNFAGELSSLSVPLLGIWGECDEVISIPGKDIRDACAQAEVLENVGHMAHMEDAGRVNDLIKAFLAQFD